MSNLADLVEPLKREVAVPGTFAATFPSTEDSDLEGTLLDAFAQVQLDGFLVGASVTDDLVTTPDLTRAETALVVIYAGCRILTAELLNRRSHIRYEASGAVYEQDQAASVLTQLLKDLSARKLALQAMVNAYGTSVYVDDQYLGRVSGDDVYSWFEI